MTEQVKVGKRKIKLGNVDKTIFKEAEISKGDIIEYYEKIAGFMLPFLENRPLMLQRFPDGINSKGFFQKDKPTYFPDWIESTTVKKEGGTVNHIVCNNAATLVYLANQACITFHTWQSKKEHPDKPDQIVIDLDPSGDDFRMLKGSLSRLRDYFEEMGISSFPMATGSKGFHIIVPIQVKKSFEEIKELINKIVQEIIERHPQHFTNATRKIKRGKYIYLDILRNAYAQTSVAPFSLRAKTYAPVATPLDWSEAVLPDVTSREYNIKNIFTRLAHNEEFWKGFFDERVRKENLAVLEKFDRD